MSDDTEITPKKDNVVSFADFVKKETPPEPEPSANVEAPQGNLPKLPKHGDLNMQLKEVIKTLKPTEKKVITLRYGLEDGHKRTKKEVSALLGLSLIHI